MAHRWSEAQNRLLIQLVKERPCLWSRSHPERSNKLAKDANWEEIDAMLGTCGANRRFKSLRDDYTRWTKGTRKEYSYADDMTFLRDEIGHRNGGITKLKDRLSADNTIEVLDESEESQGLYEEHKPSISGSGLPLGASQLLSQTLAYFQQTPVEAFHPDSGQSSKVTVTPVQGSASRGKAKRLKLEVEQAPPNEDQVYWQSPVDDTSLSRDDYQFCKLIIGAMSPLPVALRRKLKSQIFHLITETVNGYETGGKC